MSRPRLLALSLCATLLVTGCTSTQDKAAKLRAQGSAASGQKGLEVKRQNPNVSVGTTKVIQDENGTAAVVELENKTRRDFASVPVSLEVLGAKRKPVFKNDAAGLEPSLVSTSLLRGGESLLWVNDQVAVGQEIGSKARTARAKVGMPTAPPPKSIPKLSVSSPRLVKDPVSGDFARGNVTNRSKVEQQKLIIYAVARKGGRIVAAGKGGIDRLPAKGRRLYRIFFIGKPAGAELELSAPPVAFK
ncbi:MAG: hypothetical protein ACR2NV_04095 [Thermoleophilaceae bacterium]